MKKKIDWEDRRWMTASMILGGMAANYHNGLYPIIEARVKTAILMAECLIKELEERPSDLSKLSK